MRNILIIFFFITFIPLSFGQNKAIIKHDFQTEFDKLDIKDGLSSNTVLDILQDKVGYLWFATADGLNRYDGYKFLVYRNKINDSTSLSNNMVSCIEEDIYGDLWIGTLYGLNKYNRKTSTFEHYFKEKDGNSLSDNYIRALYSDKNGILWIETADGVLNKLHIHSNIFEHFQHRPVAQLYYHYHTIYQENDSILWIGGRNLDLHKFNINTGKFKKIYANPNNPTKKRTNDIACYYEDSKGNFYVTGLDGTYIFDRDSNFQRILSTSTFTILEDKQHQIWFGTGNGLYKKTHESSVFYHYNFNPNNPRSLAGNYVNKLYQDRSGVLWVATNSGLSKYSPIRKRFPHFYHIPGEKNTVSSNRITDAVEDNDGIIWLATANNGIDRFDRKNNQFTNYNTETMGKGKLSSNRVSSLYIDKDNILWIGLWSGVGFNKFNTKTKTVEHFVIDPNSRDTDWYNDFVRSNNDTLYIGVWGGPALYSFDIKNKKIIPCGNNLEVIPNNKSITKIYIERGKGLWLASPQYGIDNYSLPKRKHSYYRHFDKELKYNFKLTQKLESNNIIPSNIPLFSKLFDIVADKEEMLWLATDKGIICKKNNDNNFSLFTNNEGAIFNKSYSTLTYDSINNNIWAVNNKILIQINTTSKRTKTYNTPESNKHFSDNPNTIIYSYNFKKLFIASHNSLYGFSEAKGFSKIKAIPKLVDIAFDSTGFLWVASADSIFIFDENLDLKLSRHFSGTKKITAFTIKEGNAFLGAGNELFRLSLSKNNIITENLKYKSRYKINLDSVIIQSLTTTTNGSIVLLGTNKGLFKYYPSNKYFEIIRPYEINFNGEAIHLASALLEDYCGDLWIGTTNTGIYKKPKGTNFLHSFPYNPLDTTSFWGKNVNAIFEDSKKRLWIAGEGLNLYHRDSKTFSHFTTDNGLVSNSIFSIVEDENNNLWLGTEKGLSEFSPETASFKNYSEVDGTHSNNFSKAGLKLKSGELLFGNDKGFIIFHPDSLKLNLLIPPVVLTRIKIFEKDLFEDLSETPHLILQPNQNTLTFEFSALDYNNPAANKYRYKLKGSDLEWIETDADNRSIRYTNLPPGEYTFLLKGSNNDGVWGGLSTPVNITIESPFWTKWWFIMITIFFIIGLIVLAILKREKEFLREKKTRELEHSFLRSQMNPHFIFNSLGAIQSYIFKNRPVDAGTYLSNFAELIRLILVNSRHELILLDKEITTLKHYLELQKLRFADKLDYRFEIDKKLNLESIKIPPMMLQPFIENSIEHGFKKAKITGTIIIRVYKEKDTITMETEDNGIGIIASEKEKRKTEPSYHSLATKITRERIKNLNKRKKKKIILTIIDLKTLNQNLKGTRVSIKIPLIHINFEN
ncbi:MAG: histidine kinase [Bacteroidales bacterium]|nr:histidine kinase [Bacteroidales bacterium]